MMRKLTNMSTKTPWLNGGARRKQKAALPGPSNIRMKISAFSRGAEGQCQRVTRELTLYPNDAPIAMPSARPPRLRTRLF